MKTHALSPALQVLISGAPQSPSVTLQLLRGYLATRWDPSGYCAHALQLQMSPAMFAQTRTDHLGLGQLGPLICKSRKGALVFEDPSRILVHWPTLLRNALDLAFQAPELAVFLLGFRDLIALKSPFVLESLTRHYRLVALAEEKKIRVKPYAETLEDYDLPTSFASEKTALRQHLNDLASDPVFIRALQQLSAETHLGIELGVSPLGFSRHFQGIDPVHRRSCSMLSLSNPFPGLDKFSLPAPKTAEDPLDYSCSNLNWILRELWVAYHLSRFFQHQKQPRDTWEKDIVQNFGVASIKNYLIINWELWVGYRNKLKMTPTYLDYVYPRNTVRAKGRKASMFRTLTPLVAQQVFLDYASIIATPLSLPTPAHKRLGVLWGPTWDQGKDTTINLSNSTVIDIDILRKITSMRHKQAIRKRAAAPTTKRTTPTGPVAPLYYHFTIDSTDPRTMHKKTYGCTAIHMGRQVLFQPAWPLPDAHIFLRPKPKLGEFRHISPAGMAKEFGHTNDVDSGTPIKYVLRPGVHRIPPDDTLAYKADVLLDPDFSREAPRTSEIVQEIRRIALLKRSDFKALLRVQTVVDEDAIPEPPRYKGSWTYAEDLAIKLLYRPGMSDEDKARLNDACATRSSRNLSHRARYLRRELIAKGVYDLDELPHKNFNSSIAIEISTAKKAAAKKK